MKVTEDMIPALAWAHGCLRSWQESGTYGILSRGIDDAAEVIEIMVGDLPTVNLVDKVDKASVEFEFHRSTQAALGKVSIGMKEESESYNEAAELLDSMSTAKHVLLVPSVDGSE